jgi:hypothetical protein
LAGVEENVSIVHFDEKTQAMFTPGRRAVLHSIVNNAGYLFHGLYPSLARGYLL